MHRPPRLMELDECQVAHSRHLLKRFGNISSATVLFVLEETLESGRPAACDWGVMIALGPGFAAEGALLSGKLFRRGGGRESPDRQGAR